MNSLLQWFRGANHAPAFESDLRWAWLTLALSVGVFVAYVAIAYNWYCRSKVTHVRSDGTPLRLLSIVVLCGVCGALFYLNDFSWAAWRLYDLLLLFLAAYACRLAYRLRGMGLINERLAQLEDLERSARQYRQIAELLPHMVWTATAEGRIDFCNVRWEQYAGPDRTWLESLHPDEREEVLAWWETTVRERVPASRELRLKGDQGYRVFVVSATPIVQGEALKWLGACADIDDQKRLAAEREAQAKQRAFFLNALSHDLRSPLNNVVLNAHLLKMAARGEAETEVANIVVDNAVAAGDLVTRLLEVARAGGQDNNALDVVPVAAMLHQVTRRFARSCDQKGLYLRVVADEDVELLTDRQKLERVVANPLDNAIKFTERGGVTAELVELEDGVTIRVCDTGIGVPEGDAANLFDEFYQVNNHERDRRKGFGMGLAICRNLARQLGGDIRLADTGPDGSRFEVILKGSCARGGRRPGGEERRQPDPQSAGV